MINVKAGDTALFQDNSGRTRQVLILSGGEECICTLLHEFRKGTMVPVGGRFCDPTNLMKRSADTFISTALPVNDETLYNVRAAAAKAIGLDVSQTGLASDLRRTLKEKQELEAQIQKLTFYQDLYEHFLKTVCDRLSAPTEPQTEQKGDVTLSHTERDRIARQERRKRYAPLQRYIDLKLKELKLSRNQVDALLGYANGTISHWILGDAPAKWDELARIPALADIKAEAEKWLDSQSKEGR